MEAPREEDGGSLVRTFSYGQTSSTSLRGGTVYNGKNFEMAGDLEDGEEYERSPISQKESSDSTDEYEDEGEPETDSNPVAVPKREYENYESMSHDNGDRDEDYDEEVADGSEVEEYSENEAEEYSEEDGYYVEEGIEDGDGEDGYYYDGEDGSGEDYAPAVEED